MSAMRKSLPSLPPLPPQHWYSSPNHPAQTLRPPTLPPLDDTGRVVFTRQLWQRTMPDRHQSEQTVLNTSHASNSHAAHNNTAGSSRRTSSTTSSCSQHHSPTPSHGSKTPLTPEESPPFRSTRKRTAGIVESEDKAIDQPDISPAHTRNSSGDSSIHVCICQPDPKIPRPRNAFILYRQHHQASVVSQHPGLANPEISKIIGEQWQNQSPEVKAKWKTLAEDEKIRHQLQYPTYRYQPKRNNRRNSLSQDSSASAEKAKCQKCGGRSILAPSTPYSAAQSTGASPASIPPTPRPIVTPVSHTLPVLKELSLQSPAARRAGKFHPATNMSPHYTGQVTEEKDGAGQMSPDVKRRRYNNGPVEASTRTMPPRYGAGPPGTQVGPGTPFPFGQPQMPPPPHSYSPASAQIRRESLPPLQGAANPPPPLGPPPRPGMGYLQHRLSQGHLAQDRSLTLPPLQTGNQPGAHSGPSTGKTAEEQIMSMGFRYKIKVLCQVAPPASKGPQLPRGPLIAVEGDTPQAVKELTEWLRETLTMDDLAVKTMEGPSVGSGTDKTEAMIEYHQLAAEWLRKSSQILQAIRATPSSKRNSDAMMVDTASVLSSAKPATSARIIDENYDSSDDGSTKDGTSSNKARGPTSPPGKASSSQQPSSTHPPESMDLDTSSTPTPTSTNPYPAPNTTTINPHLLLIPLYSLHTTNAFARRIPIGPSDPYSPGDHWQWTATQWRGIIGPDLTIYVRDSMTAESTAGAVDVGHAEGRGDVGVIAVRRSGEGSEGGMGIEASVLRRLRFEVGEWVRAFLQAGKE